MSNRRELLMPHVTGTGARDKPIRLDPLARDAICAAEAPAAAHGSIR
ncbi:hypothetical protein [Halioglobus sp. Uisw_031]